MCRHHNAGQRSWANMHTEHQQINQAVLILQSNVFCNKSNNTELWVSTSRGAKKCLKAKSDFSILRSQSSSFFGSPYTHICFPSFPSSSQVSWMWRASILVGAVLFSLAKFVRKAKLKTKNSKKKVILQVFSRQKREGKKRKIRHLRIFGFQWVTETIKAWFKIYTWFLVDSQIWLNLPREYRHFWYLLLWMVATLAFFSNPKNDVGSCSMCSDFKQTCVTRRLC